MTQPRDLTTVAQVKEFLSVKPNTVTDVGLLQTLVSAASVAFRTCLNRDILSTDYDEVFDGTGTNTLTLPNYPVSAVSLLEVGPLNGRTPLVQNTDYFAGKFAVKRLYGIFCDGAASIHIKYTAGFTDVPLDLAAACAKTVALRYKQLDRLGQTSKSMGGETVNFDTSDFPKDVLTTLQNYQRKIPQASL